MESLSRFFTRTRTKHFEKATKPSDPLLTDPRDDDLIIVVMGTTGVGKSTFINRCYGEEVLATSAKLSSCTQDIAWVTKDLGGNSGQRIVLVDTPGFNDSVRSEYEILRRISVWLAHVYDKNRTVTGLVYLTAISNKRLTGSDKANCEMFQDICGKDAIGKVVMATTHWDETPPATAIDREEELKAGFWKDIKGKGGYITRVENPEDPSRIITHILETAKEIAALQIQEELVKMNKKIVDTEAGTNLRITMKELEELQKSQDFSSNPRLQAEAKQKEADIENALLHLNPTGFNRLKLFFRSHPNL